jgi:hypothetical protein
MENNEIAEGEGLILPLRGGFAVGRKFRKHGRPGAGRSVCLLEVKGCEVHLPVGEDVYGENTFALGKAKLDEAGCNVPVMPLPPGYGIGGIVGGGDGQGARGWLAVLGPAR